MIAAAAAAPINAPPANPNILQIPSSLSTSISIVEGSIPTKLDWISHITPSPNPETKPNNGSSKTPHGDSSVVSSSSSAYTYVGMHGYMQLKSIMNTIAIIIFCTTPFLCKTIHIKLLVFFFSFLLVCLSLSQQTQTLFA